MNIIAKIYIIGVAILIIAIIMNMLAIKLNIETWYSFTSKISEKGLADSFKEINFFSIIYLFIIYPLILGLPSLLLWNYLK